jgi:hypothetical protein
MLKYLVLSLITSVLLIFTIEFDNGDNSKIKVGINDVFASGCTICHTSTAECHRIIEEDKTHIYHGDAEECSGPGESE